MRFSCRLYVTLSWIGIFVKADWRPTTFLQNPLDGKYDDGGGPKAVRVIQNSIHEESVQGKQITKKYNDEPDGYVNRIPSDFVGEISRLRIPDERDIPKTLSSDEQDSTEDEDAESEENSAENNDDEDDSSKEQEDPDDSEQSHEKEEDDERGQEYDDYDEPPPNIVYDSKKVAKKPDKKRPSVVHYEVTETIPDDTKPQRPKGPVYPLPPPCPGAPPPTFPPPPPPTTKPPPRPPKSFYTPLADLPNIHPIPFFDSYFPTSYMTQSHTVPQGVYSPPNLQLPRAAFPVPKKDKVSPRFPRRASPQKIIIRYHRPAIVVRKVQQYTPVSDAVIIRQPPPPRLKEVHIHHHHGRPTPPGPVIHVHKNDDDEALEEAKFTAELAGQKLFSEAELEAATSGPFAEPPFKGKKGSNNKKEKHIHIS